MPVPDGNSEHASGSCTQEEELLHLVTAEVSRLRSIRKRDCGNCSLTSLCQADRTRSMDDSLSSLHLAECVGLRDRGNGDELLQGAEGTSL